MSFSAYLVGYFASALVYSFSLCHICYTHCRQPSWEEAVSTYCFRACRNCSISSGITDIWRWTIIMCFKKWQDNAINENSSFAIKSITFWGEDSEKSTNWFQYVLTHYNWLLFFLDNPGIYFPSFRGEKWTERGASKFHKEVTRISGYSQ